MVAVSDVGTVSMRGMASGLRWWASSACAKRREYDSGAVIKTETDMSDRVAHGGSREQANEKLKSSYVSSQRSREEKKSYDQRTPEVFLEDCSKKKKTQLSQGWQKRGDKLEEGRGSIEAPRSKRAQ